MRDFIKTITLMTGDEAFSQAYPEYSGSLRQVLDASHQKKAGSVLDVDTKVISITSDNSRYLDKSKRNYCRSAD